MITIPGKIPIRIHPFFWVLAALIGWLNSQSIPITLLWIVVITVSILVHEYGHGIASLKFGQRCRIELVGLGGVTYRQGPQLNWWKNSIIVLSGPFAGVLLGILSFVILKTVSITNPMILSLLDIFLWVNIVWSIFNLLPVFPLDGGQLLKILLEAAWGVRGMRIALWIGIVLATIGAVAAFAIGFIFMGVIFFILAFESYRSWNSSSQLTDQDQNSDLKKEFVEAQVFFQKGDLNSAWSHFSELRNKTTSGLTHTLSTIYMSKMLLDKGESKEAYLLIKPLNKQLPLESKLLLHRLAFENEDYEVVKSVANECYRFNPTSILAYHNAITFANLKDSQATLGWLRSAQRQGMEVKKESVELGCFDFIRTDQNFQTFIKREGV
jgi:stage IV sporulation protein FB